MFSLSLVERMNLLLRQEYGARKSTHKQFGAKTAKYQRLPGTKREAIPVVDNAVDSGIGGDERLSRV